MRKDRSKALWAAEFPLAFCLPPSTSPAQGLDRGLRMAFSAADCDQMPLAASDRNGVPGIWSAYADRWMAPTATQSKMTAAEQEDRRQREHKSWSFEFAKAVNGSLAGVFPLCTVDKWRTDCAALAAALKSEGLWQL